jgi:hypothetical protein
MGFLCIVTRWWRLGVQVHRTRERPQRNLCRIFFRLGYKFSVVPESRRVLDAVDCSYG